MADKLIQEIEVVAKVDEAIGKVDKLERAFDEAMKGIKQETQEANKAQQEMNNRFGKLGTAVKDFASKFKAAFVGAAVLGSLKRGAELSGEFHRTTALLAASLENVGRAQDIKKLQDFASELERVTGVSDETHRELISLALQLGFTGDRAVDATIASIGMANAMGSNANEAMKQLAKTQTGLLEETIRMVGPIRELTKEELKLGKAVDVAKENFESFVGATSAGEGTVSRGMTEMSNGLDNMLESFGRGLDELGLGTVLTKIGQTMSVVGVAAEKLFLRLKISFKTVTEGVPAAMAGFLFGEEGDASKFFTEVLRPDVQKLKDLIGAEAGAEDILFNRVPENLRRPDLGEDKDAKRKRLAQIRKEERIKEEKQFQKDLEEILKGANEEFDQMEQKEHEDRISRISSRIDEELNMRHAAIDRRMALELSLARFQDKQLQEEEQRKAKEEQVYTDFYDKLTGATMDFANASIDALFAQGNGEKHAFKEMLKNFLDFTGSKMIASGLQDSYEGASMLVTGDPRGGAKLGLGLAQVAIGTGMKAGSLAVKVPETGESKSAGVGGSQSANAGRGDAGPARAASINIFGAMTTEESAILIQRGMRQANARGFA